MTGAQASAALSAAFAVMAVGQLRMPPRLPRPRFRPGTAKPLAAFATGTMGILVLGPAGLAAAPAGYLVPDLVEHHRRRARLAAVEEDLPDVLDLLRVCVATGHSPWRAIGEVGRRHRGPLGEELERAAGAVALGLPSELALGRLQERAGARGIEPLASALARAERHGAPLGPTLAAQALEARSLRAGRAAERAARAAPKIQLVVALLLVPSVLLLVAAALVPAIVG